VIALEAAAAVVDMICFAVEHINIRMA
jgi:hypothetical protein